MKRKHRKKHEDHVDESWLIPYADILTLLLALFIVLFAASEVDSEKFQKISESFNNELQGGTGVLEKQAVIEPFDEPFKDTTLIPQIQQDKPAKVNEEEMSPQQDQIELRELQKKIDSYIKAKGLSPRIVTELTSKGLLFKIKEGVLYSSGSADISQQARITVIELSNFLVTDPPRNIFIEGHTDNVPTYSGVFPSNWELSAARAINFMKILLENNNLDPKKFSATGYGEYQPTTSNDTALGRAENRRVEVLISSYE
ncbi:flagellar motor protein MotB [Paenisporosarcina sp. TG-14]|uniref:flagellar motor protein MotB n=1 Tax=Paenisporosarcina sp. TG-14 TaxID=1231057 RepID=UPI00037BA333|nr:flagellar motor protein MotB [Paenisporosarcina sp. TG-14]